MKVTLVPQTSLDTDALFFDGKFRPLSVLIRLCIIATNPEFGRQTSIKYESMTNPLT